MISKSYCPYCIKSKEILAAENLLDRAVIVDIDTLRETKTI
jgi:glutaredoxin